MDFPPLNLIARLDSWGLNTSRDFAGGGKDRSRNRRGSRDFGALSSSQELALNVKFSLSAVAASLAEASSCPCG